MITMTLINVCITIPVKGCGLWWLFECDCLHSKDVRYGPNSTVSRAPQSKYDTCCNSFCYFIPPGFRQGFSDDQLRQHAITCDGFYFMGQVNRSGILIPTNRVRCETCNELELRVRNGPAVEDLPITNNLIPPIRDPKLKRFIPDSNLLAIMPTGSSNKEYIEEYQKLKHKHINVSINKDNDMMIYEEN